MSEHQRGSAMVPASAAVIASMDTADEVESASARFKVLALGSEPNYFLAPARVGRIRGSSTEGSGTMANEFLMSERQRRCWNRSFRWAGAV